MKRRIRLTEGDLHRIIKESVKRLIKEQSNFAQILCYLLQAGAKEIKNRINTEDYFVEPDTDENGYVNIDDDFEDVQIPFSDVKELFSSDGLKSCKNGDTVYQWIIDFGNHSFCSTKNFNDVDEAFNDCDKFVKFLKGECYAEVILLGFNKSGTVFSDIVLSFEEGTWMD